MTRRQKRMRRRVCIDLVFVVTVLMGAALLALTVREALGYHILMTYADAHFYGERTCP